MIPIRPLYDIYMIIRYLYDPYKVINVLLDGIIHVTRTRFLTAGQTYTEFSPEKRG